MVDEAMSPSDSWDWPFLLYMATVTLLRPEAAFWRMTPRKLKALIDVHVMINNPEEGKKKNSASGFIDQVL